jgi:hypothetical protein
MSDIRLSGDAWNILGYLGKNPKAQDTLVAIVRWWLVKHKIEIIIRDVKRALDQLVDVGFVIRQERVGHEATYQLNKKELNRVRAMLRDQKAE